jgi:hypothetical protein
MDTQVAGIHVNCYKKYIIDGAQMDKIMLELGNMWWGRSVAVQTPWVTSD